MARTVGDIISDARALLADLAPSTNGPSYSGTTAVRTVGMCVAEARTLINDTVAPYRYRERDLYTYFGTAILQVRRFRPDLFITGVSALPVYAVTDAELPFPVMETMYPAVVQSIVATAEMRDDTWTEDGKGRALLEGVLNSLQQPPFRYSDAALYGHLNAAVAEARRLRPDLFLGSSLGLRGGLPSFAADGAATPFPVAERYAAPFVAFVVGRAKARQNEPQDPKVASYAQAFAVQLMQAA